MSTPVGKPPRSPTRANLIRRIHRITGLCLIVPVCLLVVTGLLLEFSAPLELGRRGVTYGWVHALYNVEAPSTMRRSGSITQIGSHLLSDSHSLIVDGELLGAQALELLDVAMLNNEQLLLPRDSNAPVERSQLPDTVTTFGTTPAGALVIDTPGGIWTSEDLGATWQPGDILRLSITWLDAAIEPAQSSVRTRYGAAIINWERWLLDLHSGRFFGPAGVWVMNLAGLALLVLAFTGLNVWYRSRKLSSRSHTV